MNILSSREELLEYGSLPKAMAKLGYTIHPVTMPAYHLLQDGIRDNLNNTIGHLIELQNSLESGEVRHVPDFLIPTVRIYETALITSEVHGIFVPPTSVAVLFSNMMTHLYPAGPTVLTADDGTPNMIHTKLNTLLTEVCIILAARRLGIPVLGSCHGAQLLWYMHGRELYALPNLSHEIQGEFSLFYGDIYNPFPLKDNNFETNLNTNYETSEGYESDNEEEIQKDYFHNLLMVDSAAKWPSYHAKIHPVMTRQSIFSDTKGVTGLKIPKDKLIAKSFEYPGCIGLQWHPHRDINTKSAIHYLHQFARECMNYKATHQIQRCEIL